MTPGQSRERSAWVHAQVATAPPLTEEQMRRLERIVAGALKGLTESARTEHHATILRRTA
jgi:hypothetical protein